MAAGGFMQGVVVQQALCVDDRAAVVATLLEQQDQLLQGIEEAFRQPGAFEQEPVIVAARQQVAAVGRDRAFQRGQARAPLGTCGVDQRGLELGDIQRKRRIPAPAHRLVGDFQVGLGLGQPVAQCVEELPQVGVRLGLGAVGPEEEGDLLARQRGVAMQNQVGQQRLQARRMHGGKLRVCRRKAEMTEQSDV